MNMDELKSKTWEVKGQVKNRKDGISITFKPLVAHYQSDMLGKTLSIEDPETGAVYQIPFDDIYSFLVPEGFDLNRDERFLKGWDAGEAWARKHPEGGRI